MILPTQKNSYPPQEGCDEIQLSKRVNISSDGKYEKVVGYSRAVRAGNMIFISGTTGVDEDGKLVSKDDSYVQSKTAIENIVSIMLRMNSSLRDVVRTRVYVSASADWRGIARAHAEFFGDILPASSMIVCDFLEPKILVEIEADAIVL